MVLIFSNANNIISLACEAGGIVSASKVLSEKLPSCTENGDETLSTAAPPHISVTKPVPGPQIVRKTRK